MDDFVNQAAGYFCNYEPNSFHFKGESLYENLIWQTSLYPKPTEEEFFKKVKDFENIYNNLEYQRLRKVSYPDIAEYIDGVVKNDQNQINEYIAKCLEVKQKYPKPEVIE